MPKPIPVYVVDRPTFGGQLFIGMLIVAIAAAVLKLAIIAALCLGASLVALRIMMIRPGLSFFLLFWAGGTYMLSGIMPLMILWATLFPAAVAWLIYVNTAQPKKAATPLSLPAPEA